MEPIVWIMLFITIIALSGMGLGNLDGRRKYKLELRKEERRLVEARTKEIEERNKQVELEYRQARLELERFDRHAGGHDRAVSPVPEPATPEPSKPPDKP